MPSELYLIRFIHSITRTSAPGERLWTANQLAQGATVRFLRARNREGFDVYIYPYADRSNSGLILVDLDDADWHVIPAMRANGHAPCAVLQTSPDHLQAWVHVSPTPLVPAVATDIGKQLASLYRGDLASTDWRHLGRLAGFTNRKPTRRQAGGYAPWVKVLHAQPGLATHGAFLVQAAERRLSPPCLSIDEGVDNTACAAKQSDGSPACRETPTGSLTPAAANKIYQQWMNRLRIPQRFSPPDWSIADKWIAKELLWCRMPTSQVETILRLGSPGFPRRHSDPDDYLRRTLARAALELRRSPFPARDGRVGSLPADRVHHS